MTTETINPPSENSVLYNKLTDAMNSLAAHETGFVYESIVSKSARDLWGNDWMDVVKNILSEQTILTAAHECNSMTGIHPYDMMLACVKSKLRHTVKAQSIIELTVNDGEKDYTGKYFVLAIDKEKFEIIIAKPYFKSASGKYFNHTRIDAYKETISKLQKEISDATEKHDAIGNEIINNAKEIIQPTIPESNQAAKPEVKLNPGDQPTGAAAPAIAEKSVGAQNIEPLPITITKKWNINTELVTGICLTALAIALITGAIIYIKNQKKSSS